MTDLIVDGCVVDGVVSVHAHRDFDEWGTEFAKWYDVEAIFQGGDVWQERILDALNNGEPVYLLSSHQDFDGRSISAKCYVHSVTIDPLAGRLTAIFRDTGEAQEVRGKDLDFAIIDEGSCAEKAACECGADSVSSPLHSTWCPKHGQMG